VSRPLLFTAGELMLETHREHPGHRSVGGAAANAALAFTLTGGRAALACRLAEDDELPRLRAALERRCLWSPAVRLGGPFNAVYDIGGRCPYSRFGYTRDGSAGSRLTVDDLDDALLAAADVVLVSGVFSSLNDGGRRVGLYLVEHARPGALRAYDVNRRPALVDDVRARELYRQLAPRLDLVKADLAEARLLWGPGGPDALLARAAEQHHHVLITLGADGLLLHSRGASIRQTALPADEVDPTGAGDAALGAALHGLARGDSPDAVARSAAACGARCVTRRGAWGYADNHSPHLLQQREEE